MKLHIYSMSGILIAWPFHFSNLPITWPNVNFPPGIEHVNFTLDSLNHPTLQSLFFFILKVSIIGIPLFYIIMLNSLVYIADYMKVR